MLSPSDSNESAHTESRYDAVLKAVEVFKEDHQRLSDEFEALKQQKDNDQAAFAESLAQLE